MTANLAGKRVALIGGAGFIGHNLALELKKRGADPHIVDSLQVNNLGAFTNLDDGSPNKELYIHLINERLTLVREAEHSAAYLWTRATTTHLSRCLTAIKPDVVVQLAAVAHANRANKDPYSTFDHSLRTLENALDASRDTVGHFIFMSSSMVYGNFDDEAVTEEPVCNPIGIYGALKYAGEKIVIAYNQVFGLSYTIVRPSALYGERCVSRRVGQAFIENVLRGLPLTMNGDGTDKLDFTYIRDLVEGLILCISQPQARNQVFNLTYGGARSLNQMAEILRAHFPQIDVKHNPRDQLMPERGTLSVDKARRLLGYAPAYPLERGFVGYLDWYKTIAAKNPQLLRPQ